MSPTERLTVLVSALVASGWVKATEAQITTLGHEAIMPPELKTVVEDAGLQAATAVEALTRALDAVCAQDLTDDRGCPVERCPGDVLEETIVIALLTFLAGRYGSCSATIEGRSRSGQALSGERQQYGDPGSQPVYQAMWDGYRPNFQAD
jgi:hypothetical protein